MFKENKLFKIILSMFLCLLLSSTLSFAKNEEKDNGYLKSTPFISPKLKITTSGISFDKDSGTTNSFKKATDEVGAINNLLNEYRIMISFGSGIAVLTLMAIFIVNLMKLGNSRGNPKERQKVVVGMIFTAIATALAGSITLMTSLFYNFVK